MDKKSFRVNYYKHGKDITHFYFEDWEKTPYHCPNCGERKVWCESCCWDCYVGELYLCVACEHRFYMPHGINPLDGDQDRQRIENLASE